jgi:hypothetical protein
MSTQDTVFSKNQASVFTQRVSKISPRKTVIKREQLVLGKPKKIEHALQVSETHHDGKITPLFNNDELIGVIYECSCGKVAQILFDFEEELASKRTAATG